MRILTADWVLPVSSAPIANGAVAIENDRIAAVDTADNLKIKFPTAPAENFGAAAVVPGLVNCHAHLELTIMRGMLDSVENDFPAWLMKLARTRAEKMTAEDVELSSLFGAIEGIRAGVTCIGDVGRSGFAGLKALRTLGLRGVVFQETEYSPDESKATEYWERLKDIYLALKQEETPLIEIGLSPHAPYTVCAGLFKLIAQYAIKNDVKTTIHAAESDMEDDFMLRGEGFMAELGKKFGTAWETPGAATIQYLADLGVLESKPLLVHCVNVDTRDISLIADSGSPVAHCPKSNAKFGHGISPLQKLQAAGINVGLGSDSVARNNTCDLIEEGRFAALMARSVSDNESLLTAEEALKIMTLGGAQALGLADRTGTLEPGKQADITVISLTNSAQLPVYDPQAAVVFASTARDVALTMVAGKEIYRDGVVQMIDEGEVKRKVAKVAIKLQKKIGPAES